MTTLRETLAEHPPQETSYDAGWIEGCWCGWERPPRISNEEGWAAYFAHLEAVVLAWVGARLAGAREGVAEAIVDIRDPRRADDADSGDVADAALTTLRDALGVPVAPAGGEVAPGATGGENGRENDAEGVWERNRRVIDHEIRTPMRGHDEDGECCRKAAGICEACPFLGCDGCEAEATRRANGGAE